MENFIQRSGAGVIQHLDFSIWKKPQPGQADISSILKKINEITAQELEQLRYVPELKRKLETIIHLVEGIQRKPNTSAPQQPIKETRAARKHTKKQSFSTVVKKGLKKQRNVTIQQTNMALQAAEQKSTAEERTKAVNQIIMGINPTTGTPLANAKPVPDRMMRNVDDLTNPYLIDARDNLRTLRFRGLKRTSFVLIRQMMKVKGIDLKHIWHMSYSNATTLELIVHKDNIQEIQTKFLAGFNDENEHSPKAVLSHPYKAEGQSTAEELNALQAFIRRAAQACSITRRLGVAVFLQNQIPKEYQEKFIKDTKAIYRATGGTGGRKNE